MLIAARKGRLVAAAMLLLVSACADDASTSTDGGSGSDAPETTVAPNEETDAWALEYTGGTAGSADDSLEPVRVGFVNEQGGTLSYEEFTESALAATRYINAELGGIEGHPLELVTCFVSAPADGQECGTQMVNDDDVDVVVNGVVVSGTQQEFSVLAGRKPILVSNAVTPPDTTTEGAFAFSSLEMFLTAVAIYTIEDLEAESVAVIYTDDAAGRSGFNQGLQPFFEARGVEASGIPVPPNATGPEVQQSLLAAGADAADAVILAIPPQACIPIYDGLQQAGITAEIVTFVCAGRALEEHLEQLGVGGEAPEGWHVANLGSDTHLPDVDSGMATFLQALEEHQTEPVDAASTFVTFSMIMTVAKLMNQIGVDEVSPDSLTEAILDFGGRAMMTGEIDCPGEAPNIGLCGREVGVIRYEDGDWVEVHMGDDLIDVDEAG